MKSLSKILLSLTLVLSLQSTATYASGSQQDKKNRAIFIGPNPKGINLVGYSKYRIINNHLTLYFTAGLGADLLAGGIVLYSHGFDRSSLFASGVTGLFESCISIGYQQKIANNHFLNVGFGAGAFIIPPVGYMAGHRPILSYEYRF